MKWNSRKVRYIYMFYAVMFSLSAVFSKFHIGMGVMAVLIFSLYFWALITNRKEQR